jgi:hypothetical protein
MIKPNFIIESHRQPEFLKVAKEIKCDAEELYEKMSNMKGNTDTINEITITKCKVSENYEYLLEKGGKAIVRIICKF